MLEDLVSKLIRRGVIVEIRAGNGWRAQPLYIAKVELPHKYDIGESLPSFSFTVHGSTMDSIAKDIANRLDLVDPLIRAAEQRREHMEAVKKVRSIEKEMRIISRPVKPNMDPSTARDQPLA